MGSYQILFFSQRGWKKRKTFGEFLEKENALYLFICRAEVFSCALLSQRKCVCFIRSAFYFIRNLSFQERRKFLGEPSLMRLLY